MSKANMLMGLATLLAAGAGPMMGGVGGRMEYHTPEPSPRDIYEREHALMKSQRLRQFWFGSQYVWALNYRNAEKKALKKKYIEIVKTPLGIKQILSFENWSEDNQEAVDQLIAESGASRELDFDSEKEYERYYQVYLNNMLS